MGGGLKIQKKSTIIFGRLYYYHIFVSTFLEISFEGSDP